MNVDYVKAKAHTTVPRADVAWMDTVEPGETLRVAELPGWFQEKLVSDPWTRELFEPATAEEYLAQHGEDEEAPGGEPMPVVAARQQAVQQAQDEAADKARAALGKRGRGKAETVEA
jgi:hypothetical protein